MDEHHFTPEVVSTQFTILQLMCLYNDMGEGVENIKEIINQNDEMIKSFMRKKGLLKKVDK